MRDATNIASNETMQLQLQMVLIGSEENSRYRWHEMQCAKQVAVAQVQVSSGVGLEARTVRLVII